MFSNSFESFPIFSVASVSFLICTNEVCASELRGGEVGRWIAY